MSEYLLLRHRDIPTLNQLSVYQENGGFEAFRKTVTTMKPGEVVDIVKESGLRGRGGAGFPTGLKWNFLPNDFWPHYVVVNADESEPGTFKDREIMEGNPYQFLEGVMITCYAVQANIGYIYLRGEFWQLAQELDKCIQELEKAGLLGDDLFGKDFSLRLHTHIGAGAYICGEETALLESLEGKRGQPRVKPPFPAVYGLYNRPTVVNNVETLANVPLIIERGVAWFRSIGTEKSPGPKIFSLSGRVKKPGNYELPLGTTFRELIFGHGGGIIDDAKIKAIMPAGASSCMIIADDTALDTAMDYESVPELGCPLGSASVIIFDETVNAAWVASKTMKFFKHESCGKCIPCCEGTYWMNKILTRFVSGQAKEDDIDLLMSVARQVGGATLCPLGEFSVPAIISSIERFRSDYEALIRS
ncbi:MAG: NADH-quinone oxidoreductase subunit NuoF [Anaerolineaceae bacterium]|nr:NADH-quinone oxidoreductase subunit NuoF [Anaerolineaceae bacterium]